VLALQVFTRNVTQVTTFSVGLMYDIQHLDLARLTLRLNNKDFGCPACHNEVGNVRKRVKRAIDFLNDLFGPHLIHTNDPADQRRKVLVPHPNQEIATGLLEQGLCQTALPAFITDRILNETGPKISTSAPFVAGRGLINALTIAHPYLQKGMLSEYTGRSLTSRIPLIQV